jgi:hypothetical protein
MWWFRTLHLPGVLHFDAPVVFGTTASIAATAAFIGGVVLGLRYRKKATVNVAAEAHREKGGFVILVKPSISSVGPFRLHFANDDGAVVTVWEVFPESPDAIRNSDEDQKLDAFPGNEFVSQGETMSSGLIFRFPDKGAEVLCWGVALNVTAKGLWGGL